MLEKLLLVRNTIRYLKPSQIFYRLRKAANLFCTLGVVPKKSYDKISLISPIPELDFDPIFLARFSADRLMKDQVALLHECETFHWNEPWRVPNRTPLWNYNLHYFEYVFSLIKAYKDTKDDQYCDKSKSIILAWIEQNPKKNKGVGWDSYPTAIRLTNWLSVYTYLEKEICADEPFRKAFVSSLWEQYNYLSRHLEKDLLGNHYFENLKALVLCSLFFDDEKMLKKSIEELHRQCCEQILPDGMHFELSPMYHKLIFEDVMRVGVALRGAGRKDAAIETYLQPMLDIAYSLEEGLNRIPLFNDSGNNVAKSLDAICAAAKEHFGLIPIYRDKFPDSGYYIFKRGEWKLIVDAGQPGPRYQPGHAHCDAMSFELFKNGKPIVVNCGTYAYQCKERGFFRSTAAHNTVMADGAEQSQCWGIFRMGKRSSVKIQTVGSDYIEMGLTDQKGAAVLRKIAITENSVVISDLSNNGCSITSYLHLLDSTVCDIATENAQKSEKQIYADEFGLANIVSGLCFFGDGQIRLIIHLH